MPRLGRMAGARFRRGRLRTSETRMCARRAVAEMALHLGAPTIHPAPSLGAWCGDSLSLLTRVPDQSVQLVLTSPPYNIGKPYEVRRSVDEYVDWCALWLREIKRILTPTGAAWINLGHLEVPGRGRAVPIPYLLWAETDLYLIQEVVWTQRNGVACRRLLSPRNEKLLWFVREPRDYVFDLDQIRDTDVKYPNQRSHGRIRCNPLGKNPHRRVGYPTGHGWSRLVGADRTSSTNASSARRACDPRLLSGR